MDLLWVVLLRWLHIVGAGLAIGGIVFMRLVVPLALRGLDEPTRQQVFLSIRRRFKMMVHTAVLLLLVSGIINSIRMWDSYKGLHALWGTHLLFGVIVIGISIWLLAGEQPPRSQSAVMTVNLVLILIVVALSSTLKHVKERRAAQPSTMAQPVR
jgi:uncharacterized membrane protein